MRLWSVGISIVGWTVLGAALAGAQPQAQPLLEATSVGQQYYEHYCSACHGLDGHGKGPAAAALRTPPADLTRIAQRRGGRFPDAEIAAYIDGRASVRAHGTREMPIWGYRFSEKFGGDTLAEEAVKGHVLVLIDYLKSIQTRMKTPQH
jgi:mono/diheme cytochrome c family protein